jgi:hypothetical protein
MANIPKSPGAPKKRVLPIIHDLDKEGWPLPSATKTPLNTEAIILLIAKRHEIPLSEARFYINHMFTFLKNSMTNLEYSNYYLYGLGTITAHPTRSIYAEMSEEEKFKRNHKRFLGDDYEAKDALIQEIKTYNPYLFSDTIYKKYTIHNRYARTILGFSYKELYKRNSVQQLQELLEFLKEQKQINDNKRNGKTNSTPEITHGENA